MSRQKVLITGSIAAVALALACSKETPAPASPSAPSPSSTAAAADGSTLKVPAPTLVSPINDAKLDDVPVLKANTVSSIYGSSACALSYEFEVKDPNNTIIPTDLQATPTLTVTAQLAFETRHTWRVRATCQTSSPRAVGPWSATGSFISSTGGYIRGSEVYDPLINGKTVGQINGPVQFIPGVGVKLLSQSSWITYSVAPGGLTSGEMSVLVTNVGTVSGIEDPKNSLITMARDDGTAFNDNQYRMSIDVRGNGAMAFRFIAARGTYAETVGAERVVYPFHEALTYFVQGKWGDGTFTATFREGGFSGKTIYDLGKHYNSTYDPSPHNAFVGRPYTPGTRDSPASWEGAIIRQLWLSNRPRPASANK